MSIAEHARATSERLVQDYDEDGAVNLTGFAGSLATYAAAVGIAGLGARALGHRLPNSYAVQDVLVGGLAVSKFTRLVARSSVASPVRAPFTTFEGPAGSGEHEEDARPGHGARHTIGELLTCPFCLGVWVSTAYVGALAVAPRPARTWAAVFAVTAVSDALQHAYARLRTD